MKLTEQEKKSLTVENVNQYGQIVKAPIRKALVEKVSNGVVRSSSYTENGYAEVWLTIWPKGLGTLAERVKHLRETGKGAREIYNGQSEGWNKATATRAAYAQAIRHFEAA
jgi:hypothetical protein